MPTLVPGAGNWAAFDAIVAGLSAIGSGKYSTVECGGRWDLVPYRIVTGTIKVGIVCWQPYGVTDMGIDKVDFFLNGGAACSATAPTNNTSVDPGFAAAFYDFNVDFDTSTVGDELVEIRAIVYPTKGIPIVFSGAFDTSENSKSKGQHSMWLNANNGGTATFETRYVDAINGDDTGAGTSGDPFQTIYQARVWARTGSRADGLVIKLRAGTNYDIPAYAGDPFKNYDRWLVIEPDAGVDRADVHIATAQSEHFQGLGVKLLRLHNLTIDPGVNITQAGDVSGYVAPALWFDGCDRNGGDLDTGNAGASDSSFSRGIFHTDNDIHDMNTALPGGLLALRNTITTIGEDVFRDFQGLAALNDIDGVTQPGDNHSDLIQHQFGYGTDGQIDNVIHYMERAKHVGIVGEVPDTILMRSLFDVPTHTRIAYINCDYSAAGNTQFLHSCDVMAIWHCTWGPNAAVGSGSPVSILKDPPDSPDTEVSNLSLQHSYLESLSLGVGPPTNTLVDEPTMADTSWADQNHVRTSGTPGTNLTTGEDLDDLFINPATENYAPKEGGSLTGRTATLLCPTDILGIARVAVGGAIGAYEEGSVPTDPPVLSDIERNMQFNVFFSTTVPNTGDLVDSVTVTDPTHVPTGITGDGLVAGVITISGTPVPS